MSNQTNEVAAILVVQETVVPKRFWSDEQIADLMIPVGFAEYCSVAYEEAVAIGLRMRDEADARIAELTAEIQRLTTAGLVTQRDRECLESTAQGESS